MAKAQSPLLGYNTNVRYKGKVFHVQTEDSGLLKPHVITHLFADGGRILKSQKNSYADRVADENVSAQVKKLMQDQHKAMIIALRNGEFDLTAGVAVVAPPSSEDVSPDDKTPVLPVAAPAAPRSEGSPEISEGLDAVDIEDIVDLDGDDEALTMRPPVSPRDEAVRPVVGLRAPAPPMVTSAPPPVPPARSHAPSAASQPPPLPVSAPPPVAPTAVVAAAAPVIAVAAPQAPRPVAFGDAFVASRSLDEVILAMLEQEIAALPPARR